MASIVLSTAGSALGANVAGPIGAFFGKQLGQSLGSRIDSAFLPGTELKPIAGARLTDLAVQSSTYGKVIPVIYGTMRIAGNIIWSRPIKETATTTTSSTSGGKGGGGKVTQSSTTYSYFVTLAIAICEGPVDEVLRIWADAKQLDLSQSTVRIYLGDEAQLPDSLISSIEGAERTPAFRGLAYVVFEDFAIGNYGNRIPNFTFEVKKKALKPDYNNQLLEETITGMVMIPGAGEFVYDTQVASKVSGEVTESGVLQQGNQYAVNQHTPYGKANALVALDQMENTLPNLEWVSVVVSWFGTSLDAGDCIILPGVEYSGGGAVSPADWAVAGYSRGTAHLIGSDDGHIRYGGTPDDASLVRYLTELKNRGYKVALYPLVFMDVAGKPWRGDITGDASEVADFFTKANGYNDFIEHYVSLAAGKVDAFIIGSEMKGLTKVSSSAGVYPAVNELVSLAATVKTTLGSGVTVTYAADWSEYHHTDGGWYNLDPLWASANIDVIGIDAYFPLMDEPQSGYDIDAMIAGWTSGEGYDWYYSDGARTTTASLSAPYAWKNLDWFWNNTHTNPDSNTTGWVPQSKKIWFTEYGFPSVDGAANQPNVFYSDSTPGSRFPYHSKGRVDLMAQRSALMATEMKWQSSTMVEQMFVWTWDARPFPYWPDLGNVWADGGDWKTGHWVQGKLGTSALGAIVQDICERSGLSAQQVDVSRLQQQLDGYVIASNQTYRQALEALQAAFFFDAVESGSQIKFVPRGNTESASVVEALLVREKDNQPTFIIKRQQELELPRRVNVIYLSRAQNYQAALQYSERQVTSSSENFTVDLPIACLEQTARNIADITMFSTWKGRTTYRFILPVQYAYLEPADVVTVTVGNDVHRMRVMDTQMIGVSALKVDAVAEDITTFDFYSKVAASQTLTNANAAVAQTSFEMLDIPALPGDGEYDISLRLAACGLSEGWRGAALFRSNDGGSSYGRVYDLNQAAVMGVCNEILAEGPVHVVDEANSITVSLLSEGDLSSVNDLALLNGANGAVIGNEVIQFQYATLLAPGKYRLSYLLRGRMGTEWATASHEAQERFVLLDSRVEAIIMPEAAIGLTRGYKAVSFGASLSEATAKNLSYEAVCLKPYSPVHVEASRNGSGDITISWVRRTRLGGDWRDGVDVPLHEAAELYDVDVMDGVDVIRSFQSISAANVTYTAVEQTSDFGSVQSSVSVKIYQRSSVVGRGYAASAIL